MRNLLPKIFLRSFENVGPGQKPEQIATACFSAESAGVWLIT